MRKTRVDLSGRKGRKRGRGGGGGGESGGGGGGAQWAETVCDLAPELAKDCEIS